MIGLAAVLVVIVVIAAGLSFIGQKPAEQGPYVQRAGDYLEWSTADVLNATLTDTDHWNYTPSFSLHNQVQINRTLLVEQDETNITLIFSLIVWERMNETGLQLVEQGILPPFNEIENAVWNNGTRWYAPCPDKNWTLTQLPNHPKGTFTELPNQSILTKWGNLYCEHYSLTYTEWIQPGIPGVTQEQNSTFGTEWWLYHGILIKKYRFTIMDGVPDDNVSNFWFLTDTNIAIITENKNT
jgi:hypothetical protein